MLKTIKRKLPLERKISPPPQAKKISFFGPIDGQGIQSNDEELLTICSTCQQVFTPSEISGHLSKCKGGHVCEVCKATFSQKEYLQRHVRRKHEKSGKSSHLCSECGKACSSKNSLLVHQRTHTGLLPYSCSVCGLKFAQLNNLQIHIDIWHSNGELKDSKEKQFACDWCEKSFFYSAGLKYHMKEHIKVIVDESERRYPCEKCDKRFQFKSELERHLLSHLNRQNYPHVCMICSKKFNQLRLLTTHVLDHRDPSMATCPHCLRSFSSRAYLQKHISLHNKNKSLSNNKTDFIRNDNDENSFDYLVDLNSSMPKSQLLENVQFNEKLFMSHLGIVSGDDALCDLTNNDEIVKTQTDDDWNETTKAIGTILDKEPVELDALDHQVVAEIFNQIE